MIRSIPNIIITFTITLAIATQAYSQDLHFTNYTTAPQSLNPALTGAFQGTYKIGGIMRDQFGSFFNNGFKTQGLFAEFNIDKGIKKHHWTSIGGFLLSDTSGEVDFGTTQMGINAAYHWALDDKYENVLTVGVQMSNFKRSINIINTKYGDDSETPPTFSSGQRDFSLGFLYSARLNKTTSFNIGSSIYHIYFGDRAIDKEYQVPLRFSSHSRLSMRLNKQISFSPQLYYSRTISTRSRAGNTEQLAGQSSNLSLQAIGTYWMKKQAIDLGLGYRLGDALQVIAGYRIKGWVFTGAIDMTTSSASSYTNGSFELGAYKIFNRDPKMKIKLIELCPRL